MAFDPNAVINPIIDEVKSGKLTSEYAAFKSADTMTKVITVVMVLAFLAELTANAFGVDTKLGMILTAIVAVVAKVLNLLGVLGYTKSRTDVKVADSSAAVVLGPPIQLGTMDNADAKAGG